QLENIAHAPVERDGLAEHDPIAIEHQSIQRACRKRAGEQITSPNLQRVARDLNEIRYADARGPRKNRLHEAVVAVLITCQRPCCGAAVGAICHVGPTIVGSFRQQVALISTVRTMLGEPHASIRSDKQALRVTMARREDSSSAASQVDADGLAVCAARILRENIVRCRAMKAMVSDCQQQSVVVKECQTTADLFALE